MISFSMTRLIHSFIGMSFLLISCVSPAQEHNYMNEDLVVIQAENPISLSTPWEIKADVSDHRGTGYIQPVFGNASSINQSKSLGVMTYAFTVEEDAEYVINFRCYIPFNDGTENNDMFLKVDELQDLNNAVDNDKWQKAYSNGFLTTSSGWDWNNSFGPKKWSLHSNFESNHEFFPIRYRLNAGEHEIQIATRSSYFIVDEIYVHKSGSWDVFDLQEGNFLAEEIENEDPETGGIVTGVTDRDPITTVVISPNPSREKIHFNNLKISKEITLYDMLGHKVASHFNVQIDQGVDISSLPRGNYFVRSQGQFIGRFFKL